MVGFSCFVPDPPIFNPPNWREIWEEEGLDGNCPSITSRSPKLNDNISFFFFLFFCLMVEHSFKTGLVPWF